MDINHYKEFFEQASAAFIAVDTDFTIIAASDSYLKITKLVREEIVGRNFFEVFPDNPNDPTADGESNIRASFNRVLKNKTSDTLAVVKYDIPRPESEGGGFAIKYWQPIHSPVFDEHHQVKYIIQNVIDVTENEALINQLEIEKKALKAIEESNTRYNMMLMQSPFAFSIMKGDDLVVVLANDLMKEFWGKGNNVEGKTLLQILPELQDQPFPEMIRKVLSTGMPVYANEILAHLERHGRMEDLYFNIVYQPHHEADGSISGVVTIAYDVTETVLARIVVEESEFRYREMVFSSPSMIAIFRGEQMIIDIANDAILASWGKGKDIIGKSIFAVMPEITEQGFDTLLLSVYHTGTPVYSYETPVYLLRYGKTELLHYTFVYQPQRNINGQIVGVVVIANEVSLQATLNKKIRASEAQFRLLVEQAPVAICVLRGENYIIEIINATMVAIWDRTIEEVINRPTFDVLPELKDQGFKELLDNVYIKGERYVSEEVPINLMRNGRIDNAVVTFVYEPLREADGTISGVMAMAHEITDLVRARKSIEASEKRFQGAVTAVKGILWTNNANGEMEGQQPAWASLTGQTYDEYQGYGWAQAIHPDDAQPTIEAWNEALAERKNFQFEHRLRTKDGDWRHFSVEAIPLLHSDGLIEEWVGVHIDITEQKRYEEELERAVAERTKELAKANKELAFQNSEKSKRADELVIANKELIYQSDEKELRAAELVIANEELTFQSSEKEKRADELHIANIELAFQNKEKEKRAAELAIANIELAFQNQEREHRAAELIIANDELNFQSEQKEHRASELISANKELIFQSEEKEKRADELVVANKELAFQNEEKEKRADELVVANKELAFQNNEKEKRADELIVANKELAFQNNEKEKRAKELIIANKELAFQSKQKETRAAELIIANEELVFQGEEKETRAAELIVANRELAYQNEEKEKRAKELTAANKELELFVHISSHDLQEPLRKLQIAASRIDGLDYENISENGKEQFKRMKNAAQSMQTLIEDILTYATTNKEPTFIEHSDLNTIIKEVSAEFQEIIDEKHAVIDISELCEVKVIPFHFRQLMHNLIGNALKFSSPERKPRISIKSLNITYSKANSMDLTPGKEYCHITVADNGIGFEPEYSEKIFEVFQRLHGKERYQGTGIGLAIVKKIVESQQGFITATGTLNRGATFDIYIPTH